MSSETDPWSDYRFAILNKIDLSAHAKQHKDNFTVRTTLAADAAAGKALYPDHFVGYCVYQETFGGVCAETVVTSSWDSYLDFLKPTEAPKFEFAAARFLKGSAILTIGTATDTDHTPVFIVNAEKNVTGDTAVGADSKTEIVATDTFVGSAEKFGDSRRAEQLRATVANATATGTAFPCTAAGVLTGECGNGTKTWAALLAETNLDYTPVGQSGF